MMEELDRGTRDDRLGDVKDQNLCREAGSEWHKFWNRQWAHDGTDVEMDRIDLCQVEGHVLACRCVRHTFIVAFDS